LAVPLPEDVDGAVVAYMTRWCGYCVAARRLLTQRGIEFVEVDVSGDTDARRWLRERSGQHTVPQIFIHGRSIGGYVELRALDRSGELAAAVTG
jgi:glutaredoxin 3